MGEKTGQRNPQSPSRIRELIVNLSSWMQRGAFSTEESTSQVRPRYESSTKYTPRAMESECGLRVTVGRRSAAPQFERRHRIDMRRDLATVWCWPMAH